MINLNPLWMILYEQIAAGLVGGDTPAETLDRPPAAVQPPSSRQLEEVLSRLDRLVIVTHAMWTLLAERAGVTEDDLVRRVTELDARDGTKDGRVTPKLMTCTCGATVSQKFGRCFFCGKEYPASAFGI